MTKTNGDSANYFKQKLQVITNGLFVVAISVAGWALKTTMDHSAEIAKMNVHFKGIEKALTELSKDNGKKVTEIQGLKKDVVKLQTIISLSNKGKRKKRK